MMQWLFFVSIIHDWKREENSGRANTAMAMQKFIFTNEIGKLSNKSLYDIEKLRELLSSDES